MPVRSRSRLARAGESDGNGILDEGQVELVPGPDGGHDLGQRPPRPVRVVGQRPVADRRRRDPQPLGVVGQRPGRDLDPRIAGGGVAGDLLAQRVERPAGPRIAAGDARRDALAGAAQELPQGQAGGLRLEVPDRDVGGTQRAHEQAALADGQVRVVQPLPDGLGCERVGPEQARRDVALDDGAERRIAGHPVADAGQPLVGDELEDEVLASVEAHLAHDDRRAERDADGRGTDLGDAHGSMMGPERGVAPGTIAR